MHIVIGGAANGKRQYVKEHVTNDTVWLGNETPLELNRTIDAPLVICGLEQWMATRLQEEDAAIKEILDFIRNKEVTMILTDIGRGIVPMNPTERALRDACGRLNQQLMKEATSVTRIWYGIPQKLK